MNMETAEGNFGVKYRLVLQSGAGNALRAALAADLRHITTTLSVFQPPSRFLRCQTTTGLISRSVNSADIPRTETECLGGKGREVDSNFVEKRRNGPWTIS